MQEGLRSKDLKQPLFLILPLTVTVSVRTVSDQQEERRTEDEMVE